MRFNVNMAAFAMALLSLVVSVYLLTVKKPKAEGRDGTPGAHGAPAATVSEGSEDAEMERLEQTIAGLAGEFAELRAVLGPEERGAAGVDGEGEPFTPVSQRLRSVEASLARLQSAFDGISLESASADRDALFREPEGYLKADEYFAAGKFAIAGEGYLAFLEAHPDHPDAYDVLQNARNAFKKAGYLDKAIWAQEELINNRGEPQPMDLITLAGLEKDAGLYDAAIEHIESAGELYGPGSNRLWQRMYSAWYHQLRDGNEAGLRKYREIEQEIVKAGYAEERLGERVREKIAEIERLQAGGR